MIDRPALDGRTTHARRSGSKPDIASPIPENPMGSSIGATDFLTTLRAPARVDVDQLFSIVYQELRAIAHRQLRARQRDGDPTPTLATTALVNEAYLKLVDQSHATWRDRAHFLSIAAVAMRHILVDHARARLTEKRGGGRRRITLEENLLNLDREAEQLVALDDGLKELESMNSRLARVVEMRFFAGLAEHEIAEVLGVTVRTIERDWAKARALLRQALEA
jgi:RNA polymerase sigma factor (TIGR02999 family)